MRAVRRRIRRVGEGFGTGRPGRGRLHPGRPSGGVTVVRGGDAHAWPEVLISGRWVSFEPTPQLPSGELAPPGVLGPAGLGRSNPTGPGTQPRVSIPVVTQPVPTSRPSTVPNQVPVHTGSGLDVLWIVLALGVAMAVALYLVLRRVRRTPIDRLVRAWESIDRALARRGAARPQWRTPVRQVTVLSSLPQTDQGQAALVDLAAIATLLQNVTYGSSELAPDDVEWAVRTARRARRAISSGELRLPVEGVPESSRRPVRIDRFIGLRRSPPEFTSPSSARGRAGV